MSRCIDSAGHSWVEIKSYAQDPSGVVEYERCIRCRGVRMPTPPADHTEEMFPVVDDLLLLREELQGGIS